MKSIEETHPSLTKFVFLEVNLINSEPINVGYDCFKLLNIPENRRLSMREDDFRKHTVDKTIVESQYVHKDALLKIIKHNSFTIELQGDCYAVNLVNADGLIEELGLEAPLQREEP